MPRWCAPSVKRWPAAPTATCAPGSFLDLLRRGFSVDDARRQLDIAIDWGRYGELYDYDSVSDEITADPAAGIQQAASSTTSGATR